MWGKKNNENDKVNSYCIVKHYRPPMQGSFWQAHKKDKAAKTNIFDKTNAIVNTIALSADHCEARLRHIINPEKTKPKDPVVVKELTI